MASDMKTNAVVMVKAIVARGRSIDVPLPSGEREQVGFVDGGNGEAKPVFRAKCRKYREFEEVELPLDEVRRLQDSGYLIDPDNLPPPTQENSSNPFAPGRIVDLTRS
ncbi:hypothetical protein LOC51_08625 [Rubrivivax sp. JA1024]|nr:hypothetical protein [Rubrivivax sp. JA1024]